MKLTTDDKTVLGAIVCAAVDAAVRGEEYSPDPVDAAVHPALEEKCGCFVTLKTGGKLRGCIGCFTSEEPLYHTAARYAFYSAREDPRFAGNRIRPDELDTVAIEVSCLSPLQRCDDPSVVRLGVDGIYVRAGGRSGCFLPQVATETGWTTEEFWGHCCRDKAGLDWDAWRNPTTECLTFTADIFTCR